MLNGYFTSLVLAGFVGGHITIDILDNHMALDTVGDRLKFARTRKKMTQLQLAGAIGITDTAISQIERSYSKSFSGANLLRAAAVLDVNPLWLVEGKGEIDSAITATKAEVLDLLGSLSDTELGTIKAVIAALRGQHQ
jgi:transcriptional regulator with XRE-family HTH domain